nr:RNA-directed DNA polymerase, eukaryota [Tanacetum cinerariifolium]
SSESCLYYTAMIRILKSFNLALLKKWQWRLNSNPKALWIKVVKAFHGQDGGFGLNDNISNGIWFNLSSRGIDISMISFPSCNGNVETFNYVFFECVITKDIWNLVRNWCDIMFSSFTSYEHWKNWFGLWKDPREKTHRLFVILPPLSGGFGVGLIGSNLLCWLRVLD